MWSHNLDDFLEQEKFAAGPMLQTLVIQDMGGTKKSIQAGIVMVKEMLPIANQAMRQPVSVPTSPSPGRSGCSPDPGGALRKKALSILRYYNRVDRNTRSVVRYTAKE